jgi:hypothetical protein
MIKKYKTLILVFVVMCLASCSTNTLYVENSFPKSKLILEKDPNQKEFYSSTYESVSQKIYDDNIKIHVLNKGENEFTLDKSSDKYAIYFILPKLANQGKTQTWKYLLNSSSGGEFSILGDGSIQKK